MINILGKGGFAGELAALIRNVDGMRYADLRFCEDGKLSAVQQAFINANEVSCEPKFAMGVGSPHLKQKWAKQLWTEDEFYWKMFPLIRGKTSIILDETVLCGEGCIFCDGTILTTGITIGEFVTINLGCSVGHGVEIGNFVTLAPGVRVNGGAKIGELTDVGSGVIINPKVEIPPRGVIGAGSVIIKTPELPEFLLNGTWVCGKEEYNIKSWNDVQSYTIVGNPGRIVRINGRRI
jgi:acetyltransferase-like isoleucine patch superfamily enzyme